LKTKVIHTVCVKVFISLWSNDKLDKETNCNPKPYSVSRATEAEQLQLWRLPGHSSPRKNNSLHESHKVLLLFGMEGGRIRTA
jgi:hypothetical protein